MTDIETVAITGATGFVGGHLARIYLERGFSLRLLVRPSSNLDALPDNVRARLGEAVELHEGDLTRPATLEGFCDGVDGLVHAACAVKGTFDESQASAEVFHAVNVDGTANIALEAARAGVRMVHLSSTAAMGPVAGGHVDEQTPCRPEAPYQRSKRQAEITLEHMTHDEDLDVVILRPCLILGPGKDGGEPLELFELVKRGVFPKIGGTLPQTKPLVDVRDVVQATMNALDHGSSGGVYLIHSDGGHRLDDILEVVRRLVGARRAGIPVPELPVRAASYGFEAIAAVLPRFNPPITPGRLDLFLADRRISIAKARRELNFEPQHTDLYEMFGWTYVGYVRDGQLNA
jgi:nucleoside-diphosphate-sugar epimerase